MTNRKVTDVSITLDHIEIYVDEKNKEKLPRSVAEAIERFRTMNLDNFNSTIIEMAMLGGISPTAHIIKDFACNTIGGFNKLISALLYGYEIEERRYPMNRIEEIKERLKAGEHTEDGYQGFYAREDIQYLLSKLEAAEEAIKDSKNALDPTP